MAGELPFSSVPRKTQTAWVEAQSLILGMDLSAYLDSLTVPRCTFKYLTLTVVLSLYKPCSLNAHGRSLTPTAWVAELQSRFEPASVKSLLYLPQILTLSGHIVGPAKWA